MLKFLFWMHYALMSLKIVGYLKSQVFFRLGIQKGFFCQFGTQSNLFSFPICKRCTAYPASQECSHCLHNAFPVRHRSVHRKLLPSTQDSRFRSAKWTCSFSSQSLFPFRYALWTCSPPVWHETLKCPLFSHFCMAEMYFFSLAIIWTFWEKNPQKHMSLSCKGPRRTIKSRSWVNGPYGDWIHDLGVISTRLWPTDLLL